MWRPGARSILAAAAISTGSFAGDGTLQFDAGYTLGATSSISTANVVFSAGATNLAGTYSAANTTLSGGVLTVGASQTTVVENFTQTDGTLSGPGTVTVLSKGAFLGGDQCWRPEAAPRYCRGEAD